MEIQFSISSDVLGEKCNPSNVFYEVYKYRTTAQLSYTKADKLADH